MAISRDPGIRLRDVAVTCELTERTVRAIVADLEAAGCLIRSRDGRRHRHEIAEGAMFRHRPPVDAQMPDGANPYGGEGRHRPG
ncbi:AsnC family transcriptional regulator [Streptomyces vinaceus]|uniref:AsnC family transcriptional regulator n=1 Tax=Streptomyces vinaceus TaxID=1960 RepID=UPI003679F912